MVTLYGVLSCLCLLLYIFADNKTQGSYLIASALFGIASILMKMI